MLLGTRHICRIYYVLLPLIVNSNIYCWYCSVQLVCLSVCAVWSILSMKTFLACAIMRPALVAGGMPSVAQGCIAAALLHAPVDVIGCGGHCCGDAQMSTNVRTQPGSALDCQEAEI